MTKIEFVELVQKAEKAVKSFTEATTQALVNKESVALVGFGTFTAVEIAEKSGKVPGTNKAYTKAAHTSPKFKAGKSLKDSVAG